MHSLTWNGEGSSTNWKSLTEKNPILHPTVPTTTRCRRRRCLACRWTAYRHQVPHLFQRVPQRVTCTTSGVIYMIKCTRRQCSQWRVVRETGCPLHIRCNSLRYAIQHWGYGRVAAHFNQLEGDHSPWIMVLETVTGGRLQRSIRKQFWDQRV